MRIVGVSYLRRHFDSADSSRREHRHRPALATDRHTQQTGSDPVQPARDGHETDPQGRARQSRQGGHECRGLTFSPTRIWLTPFSNAYQHNAPWIFRPSADSDGCVPRPAAVVTYTRNTCLREPIFHRPACITFTQSAMRKAPAHCSAPIREAVTDSPSCARPVSQTIRRRELTRTSRFQPTRRNCLYVSCHRPRSANSY